MPRKKVAKSKSLSVKTNPALEADLAYLRDALQERQPYRPSIPLSEVVQYAISQTAEMHRANDELDEASETLDALEGLNEAAMAALDEAMKDMPEAKADVPPLSKQAADALLEGDDGTSAEWDPTADTL